MRVKVAEFQPLLVVLYPIIGFTGMIQVDTLIKIAGLVSPLPTLGPLGMFVTALAYTLVLTLFLSIMDGANLVFRIVAVFLLSAICGAIFYFGVTYVVYFVTSTFGAEVHLDQGAIQPWFALATLISGYFMAFVALYFVESTDIKDFSKTWIISTQLFYLGVGIYSLGYMGIGPTMLVDMIKGGH